MKLSHTFSQYRCLRHFSAFVILMLILVLSDHQSSFAQTDVYNLENSRRFAHYLYSKKDFRQAAAEFERVVFLAPEDSVARYYLIASYRRSGHAPQTGLMRYRELFGGGADVNADLRKEVALLFAADGNYAGMQRYLQDVKGFTPSDSLLLISSLIFQSKYEDALLFTSDYPQGDLYSIVKRSSSLPYKNPNLALAMSVVIPGTGKIYAGQWKDGLFSLLFTGMSAWQSYRAFHKEGVKSAFGWFYGGVSLGFYLGNLYGSYKAVSKYNHQLDHAIKHELENYLYRLD